MDGSMSVDLMRIHIVVVKQITGGAGITICTSHGKSGCYNVSKGFPFLSDLAIIHFVVHINIYSLAVVTKIQKLRKYEQTIHVSV